MGKNLNSLPPQARLVRIFDSLKPNQDVFVQLVGGLGGCGSNQIIGPSKMDISGIYIHICNMNINEQILQSFWHPNLLSSRREKSHRVKFQVGLCCKLGQSLNQQFCGVCMCASKRTQLKMFQKG